MADGKPCQPKGQGGKKGGMKAASKGGEKPMGGRKKGDRDDY